MKSYRVAFTVLTGWLSLTVHGFSLNLQPEAFLSIRATEYGTDNLRDDGISIERLSLRLGGGTPDRFQWRITGDANGIDTRNGLEEAWASFSWADSFRLTLGQFKVAMGAEYSIPEEELPFIGYSFPAYLTGRTDSGLMADGSLLNGAMFYEASLTAGLGYDENGQDIDGRMAAGKLTAYPLAYWTGSDGWADLLSGLFISSAYSITSDFEGELDVTTPRRNKLFDTDRLKADDQRFYHISWGIDLGPIRLLHEFNRGSLTGTDLPDGDSVDFDDQITAWAASLSWRIHGEPYDSRPLGGRIPKDRSTLAQEGHAFELALRYTNADIDRDFFRTGITDYDTSSQEFRVISGAVNWDPCKWTRITFQVDRSITDQSPRAFSGEDRDTTYTLQYMIRY